jgi:hypothetical protein
VKIELGKMCLFTNFHPCSVGLESATPVWIFSFFSNNKAIDPLVEFVSFYENIKGIVNKRIYFIKK